MKNSYFLLLAIIIGNTALAQNIYRIDDSGKISPQVSTAKQSFFIFQIDKKFKGKTFDILDNGTLQNPQGNILDTDIPKDKLGQYTITVQSDHKIKECRKCPTPVANTFMIRLDGKSKGVFHLEPIANTPETTTNLTIITSENQQLPDTSRIDQANSILNDAITISTLIKHVTNKRKIQTFLQEKYGVKDQTQNHFLEIAIPDKIWASVEGVDDTNGSIGTISSSLAGLDVTKIADGFAKFIVKRTKEELTIAFFKKFKEDIVNYPDLKSIFPNTYFLLSAIDVQIYNYSNYINNLREAFREDLSAIDQNLPSIVNNHKEFFDKDQHQKFAFALRSACYITSGIQDKVHPGDMLDGFPIHYLDSITGQDQANFKVLKGAMQSLQLFSESLKETDTTKHTYWVDIDKVRRVVNDQTALQIYIGLLLETARIKYDNILFSNAADKSLYVLLNTEAKANKFQQDYQSYKNYFLSLGNKLQELNQMIKEYDKEATDSVKVERYSSYIKNSAKLLQAALRIQEVSALSDIPKIKNLELNTKKYFEVIYNITDIAAAINSKRYALVVNHLITTYNIVYSTPEKSQADTNTAKLSRKEKQTSSVMEKLTKYGAFMANMIDAKKSDEVAAAIESVALPVGSASNKRDTSFNVSLNAYCGLFTGSEIIKGVDANKPFKFNSYGITAPIGISISKGNSLFFLIPTGKTAFSSSFFISLVDIGAITAYRFQDSTTEQVPTIKLGDIFSPGLFLSIGVPKTPISVNFGAQTGPNLRKVNSTTNDYSKNTYIRYSLSVCVDIPLLNLYTKSKN
jgi:hypothetical protein